jgi:hypothetical protein
VAVAVARHRSAARGLALPSTGRALPCPGARTKSVFRPTKVRSGHYRGLWRWTSRKRDPVLGKMGCTVDGAHRCIAADEWHYPPAVSGQLDRTFRPLTGRRRLAIAGQLHEIEYRLGDRAVVNYRIGRSERMQGKRREPMWIIIVRAASQTVP